MPTIEEIANRHGGLPAFNVGDEVRSLANDVAKDVTYIVTKIKTNNKVDVRTNDNDRFKYSDIDCGVLEKAGF